MLPGQSFFDTSRSVEIHRCVIVSDPSRFPDDDVVFVKLTSYGPGKDPTCVITPAEYSSLDRDSCVYFLDVRRTKPSNLQGAILNGLINLDTVVPAEVLAKIRKGIGESKDVPIGIKKLLQVQGLISWVMPQPPAPPLEPDLDIPF